MAEKRITKKKLKKRNKKKLWSQLDKLNEKSNLEVVWSNQEMRVRETCDLCQSRVELNEQKFYECINSQCGVIYRDTLDETAEWRYYGEDDNNMSDPTRCGMPVNPLLKHHHTVVK